MPQRLGTLRAVPLTEAAHANYCSHCGRPPSEGPGRFSRICSRCEMGLILQCDPRLAPGPGDPFLVTDDELLVCALSQGGERLLGRPEPSVIHRALSRLVIGAIEDEHGVPALPRLMRMAAAGQLDFATTVVGLVEAGSATHYRARVGCSGPPSAALLVIDEPVD